VSRHHPFVIPRGAYTLAGSLMLPPDAAPDRPVPTAVFVGGPGPAPLTRYSDQGALRWPMAWGQVFVAEGIAVLAYDQRGGGVSSGEYATADRDDLFAEALEVVQMARAQPETAATAAVGWADGAAFALDLAARGEVDAAVLLSVPFLTAEVRYERQMRDLARRGGFSERVVAIRLERWRAEMASVARKVAEGDAYSVQEVGGRPVTLNLSRFLQTSNFDPAALVPSVNCPILLLHGEEDAIIASEESAMLAGELHAPCRRITYPGVQHFLYRHPEAASDAARWLAQTLLRH
jgi:uncharacterized protein